MMSEALTEPTNQVTIRNCASLGGSSIIYLPFGNHESDLDINK